MPLSAPFFAAISPDGRVSARVCVPECLLAGIPFANSRVHQVCQLGEAWLMRRDTTYIRAKSSAMRVQSFIDAS